MATIDTTVRGLDHDYFPFVRYADAPRLRLPGDAPLAFNVVVVLQHFPLDARPAFPIPAGLPRPWPDLGSALQREVGYTDGLWRLLDALDEAGAQATFVVDRGSIPFLHDARAAIARPGNSLAAGGEHALRLHTAALSADEERALIGGTLDALQAAFGRRPTGWCSPAGAQSPRTLPLLAGLGVGFCGDLCNDERPYPMRTTNGPLVALPLNPFYGDLFCLLEKRQSMDDYVGATMAALDVLHAEGRQAPTVLSWVLHPWVSGVPHRIEGVRRVLAHARGLPGTALVSADAIVAALPG